MHHIVFIICRTVCRESELVKKAKHSRRWLVELVHVGDDPVWHELFVFNPVFSIPEGRKSENIQIINSLTYFLAQASSSRI